MRKLLEITTPENVNVEYELAGLGSRFAAIIIDHIIQAFFIAIITFGLFFIVYDKNSIFENAIHFAYILITVVTIVYFLYFIIMETVMKGQTLGKKVMKLQVVKENGQPIGGFDALIRNILRIIDLPFVFYIVGSIFIILSKNYKRVGDYAAGTVVIRLKKTSQPITLENILKNISSYEEAEAGLVNLYPVNNYEYSILKDFLAREGKLGKREEVFEYHLNKYFMEKFSLESAPDNPKDFFREIVRMNSGI